MSEEIIVPVEEPVKRGRGRPRKAVRPTRVPMSGQRMRMHIDEEDKDPNFHYAWINDQSGLVHRAKKAGYEHVPLTEIPSWGTPDVDSADPTASIISMPVGNKVIAYLMKQPMEYYEEDQDEMNALVNARESDMKKELNSGQNGTYGKVEFE